MKVYIQVNILEVQNVASQLTDGQIVWKVFGQTHFLYFHLLVRYLLDQNWNLARTF